MVTTECEMALRPGGVFRTVMRLPDGTEHDTDGCFLDVVPDSRVVFTDALRPGWRPAEASFLTAIITLADVEEGTEYTARVLHKDAADRERHEQMGFHEGWGACIDQLAKLAAGWRR